MKQSKLRVLKFSCILFASILFLLSQNIQAQNKKKKSKKGETTEVTPTPPKKDKTITELVKSSKKIEGLFPVYQDTITGSLQMLISKNQINKEFIYFSQMADGILDAGRFNRGSYLGSKVFKIEKLL